MQRFSTWLVAAATLMGLQAPAAGAFVDSPEECLRISLAWTSDVASGQAEATVVPAAIRGYAAAPFGERAEALLVQELEKKGEKVESIFGKTIDARAQSPGCLQFAPFLLHVFTEVRRAHGLDRWRFASTSA